MIKLILPQTEVGKDIETIEVWIYATSVDDASSDADKTSQIMTVGMYW